MLDPRNPLASARALLGQRYSAHGARTLHRYRSTFYSWRQSHFVEFPDDEARSVIWKFLDEAKVRGDEGELLPFCPNRANVANVVDALHAAAIVPAELHLPVWVGDLPEGYPGPRLLLPCENGLLRLDTHEVLPHTAKLFVLNGLPFSFDPEASPPEMWLRFLDAILPDDAESVQALQEWFGYSLGFDTHLQKVLLVIGPPRSGKGTIARVWTALVGALNVVTPTLASLETNFGMSALIGKRLAIVTDARLSARADQARIVERVLSLSGEDVQTIDRKHRSAWVGRLGTLLAIMTNETPRLGDASGAFASRFIIVELTRSFLGQEDLELADKLLTELPSILRWALEGRRRLYTRGRFVQPSAAESVVHDLADLSSPIGLFIRECCTVGESLWTTMNDLFVAWQVWCGQRPRPHRQRPGLRARPAGCGAVYP